MRIGKTAQESSATVKTAPRRFFWESLAGDRHKRGARGPWPQGHTAYLKFANQGAMNCKTRPIPQLRHGERSGCRLHTLFGGWPAAGVAAPLVATDSNNNKNCTGGGGGVHRRLECVLSQHATDVQQSDGLSSGMETPHLLPKAPPPLTITITWPAPPSSNPSYTWVTLAALPCGFTPPQAQAAGRWGRGIRLLHLCIAVLPFRGHNRPIKRRPAPHPLSRRKHGPGH